MKLFFHLSLFVLPGDGLWDGLGADGNLDALLPLLPPRVGEDIVVFGVQLVRVVNLHGCDQVRPENLQHVARKQESVRNRMTQRRHSACGGNFSGKMLYDSLQISEVIRYNHALASGVSSSEQIFTKV